jgi:hypothetical protein
LRRPVGIEVTIPIAEHDITVDVVISRVESVCNSVPLFPFAFVFNQKKVDWLNVATIVVDLGVVEWAINDDFLVFELTSLCNVESDSLVLSSGREFYLSILTTSFTFFAFHDDCKAGGQFLARTSLDNIVASISECNSEDKVKFELGKISHTSIPEKLA